jgi:N-acyl amino acid synthase of PEP-CTERM/exosortase system
MPTADILRDATPAGQSARPLSTHAGSSWAPHFAFAELTKGVDDPLLTSVFALRYRVYCVDRRFLPAEDYPDRLESDAFDRMSTHFCAFDRQDRVVGAVRLVRASATSPFPFQQHCHQLFEGVALPPTGQAAEVSRLVIDRHFLRRAGDGPEGIPLEEAQADEAPCERLERRTNKPEIVLGLYRSMYRHSRRTGIRYWYAAMERSLARALMRYQFEFRRIGPETDYFGPVAPYVASLDELEQRLARENPDLLRWFLED